MEPMMPTITLEGENGKQITVSLQAAFTGLVQHLIEMRQDVIKLAMEVQALKTPPDKLN
jgi:hypothetical protein